MASGFHSQSLACRGTGTLEKVALVQVADAMHDAWITGTASIEYRASTLGWTKADLLSHADASFQIEARDASLPHLTLAGESSPLRVNRFTGTIAFARREVRDRTRQTADSRRHLPIKRHRVLEQGPRYQTGA